jgi:type I restriction enzyme S subunit
LLSAKNIDRGRVNITEGESLISDADHAAITANGFPREHDLLVTIVGTIGRSAVYAFKEAHSFQRSVSFLRFSSAILPHYAHHWFESVYMQSALALAAQGSAQGGVYLGSLRSLTLLAPPLAEQQAIATFLDAECKRIDTLIERQQRLIELLQEKRQAVITHAVTKGLNADVPLKHSGVEWLGEIPDHWTAKPLRTVTHAIATGPFGSQLHAEDYIQDGVPVINPSHLVNGRIVADSACTVLAELASQLARHKLFVGDIIVARRGELGRCALVTVNENGWLCGTGSMIVKTSSALHTSYALNLIACSLVRQWLELQSVGSTMSNLNASILGSLHIPVPPLAEQQAIVEYLDAETRRIDNTIAKAQRSIELMQERRSALISAAVTGKIDVRGASERNSFRTQV